jgi:hypothetical protein
MAKYFLEAAPTVRVVGGLVFVALKGHPFYMRISTFHAFVGASNRAIREFHCSEADPILLGVEQKRRRKH